MSDLNSNSNRDWPHGLAVLLVCTTFPLIWVGGLVTTTQAGMAVPDWPNTYGYNLFLYPLSTWLSGPWDLFIEHGHRLLGALVGMITIGVVCAIWRYEPRKWVRVFSLLTLAAVVGQGILGGMRVLLDERTLAMIHGCTGPAFFSMTVVLAVVTSRRWKELSSAPAAEKQLEFDGSTARLALLTPMLAYVQLILGAQVRHIPVGASSLQFQLAVYFHLFMAAVLTLEVTMLVVSLVRGKYLRERTLRRPTLALVTLLVLQVCLGGASWVAKYAWPGFLANQNWTAGYTIDAGSILQSVIITAHVAVGSLILVNSLVLAMRFSRLRQLAIAEGNHATPSKRVDPSHASANFAIVGNWPLGALQLEGTR